MDQHKPIRELALFAGGGLGLLASDHLGHELVCAVEWDKHALRVLQARMADGWLRKAPIWDNVFTFDGKEWAGRVDMVSAGFPCQPFSTNGAMRAGDDPRNGWPATIRIVREVRPKFVWLENVKGLITGKHGYWRTILQDLCDAGYDAVWRVISAKSAGAPHHRDRVFLLGVRRGLDTASTLAYLGPYVADADGSFMQTVRCPLRGQEAKPWDLLATWREGERGIHRVYDGRPKGLDLSNNQRLTVLGNGQVPAQVALAWLTLVKDYTEIKP